MKKTFEQRKAKKATVRAKKHITGGLSGNSHDRRQRRRLDEYVATLNSKKREAK